MKSSKFQKLPAHHIDTSVILEPKDTENGFYCQKYLNLVGYKFRGKFSLLVLGELLLKLLKFETLKEQYDLVDSITSLIRNRKIFFYSVFENEELCRQVKENNVRIEKSDLFIFLSAVEDKATVFVTLDTALVDNEVLEREFGIKIKHPRDLI